MADPATEQLQLLLELDARHDDLLLRLEELDERIVAALRESQALLKPLAISAPPAPPEGPSPWARAA